jgi:predicted negative regulator of RcsB-dependent stress response
LIVDLSNAFSSSIQSFFAKNIICLVIAIIIAFIGIFCILVNS